MLHSGETNRIMVSQKIKDEMDYNWQREHFQGSAVNTLTLIKILCVYNAKSFNCRARQGCFMPQYRQWVSNIYEPYDISSLYVNRDNGYCGMPEESVSRSIVTCFENLDLLNVKLSNSICVKRLTFDI